MNNRDAVHQYLSKLGTYLARLNEAEVNEVLREIESHIYDSIELAEHNSDPINITDILAGFGSPRELAQQYVEHILEGTPPPKGFSAIQKVKQTATVGLYWTTAIFGYFFGSLIIVSSAFKLAVPDLFGVWSAAGGNSIVVGLVEENQQVGEEIVGFWFIPIALILGALLIKLTHSILRVLKRSEEMSRPSI
ncbi:DUF1700 domain-containing protein [Paraglaciecola arctica]|uniref:DUF1700 domain-containing protein n=1 Tax=Paraglaciecola arctica TaxID=1128911 RepID=UPI001C06E863|nr:DUF1700 domain-containing protein [Paraglaciecola arctica]MBU3006119.1 DUF1700 domain-containing protein [Paraglaciecola arctica]